jgi:hypothetical protein
MDVEWVWNGWNGCGMGRVGMNCVGMIEEYKETLPVWYQTGEWVGMGQNG